MYISLREATKYCNYSQDYLKLRARQGKLKAVKIGRNWVITKEWLQEYLAKVAQPRPMLDVRRPAGRRNAKSDGAKKMCLLRASTKPGLARRVVLIFLILGVLTVGGIFAPHHKNGGGFKYSVNTFKAYFQWVEDRTASLQFDKILPARVIEIR